MSCSADLKSDRQLAWAEEVKRVLQKNVVFSEYKDF
jgi:hypothetical protein